MAYQAFIEPTNRTTETALFGDEVTSTAEPKSNFQGLDADANNTQVTYLRNDGNSITLKTGPGLLLQVMAGDKIKIRSYAWYRSQEHQPANNYAVDNIVSQLSGLLTNTLTAGVGEKFSALQITNNGSNFLIPPLHNFLSSPDHIANDSRPKAYLNWVLMDGEQLQFQSGGSGAVPLYQYDLMLNICFLRSK